MNAKQKFLTMLVACVGFASTSLASELVYHDSNGNLRSKPLLFYF
ncbi:MAG: hypothetical protein Q4D21_03220 [Phascolarctobacterium sp.]|nr:hypothetical protein [Phascolarctobacterium sp.]